MTESTTRTIEPDVNNPRPAMDQLRIFVMQYNPEDHIDEFVGKVAAHVIGNLGSSLHDDIKEKSNEGIKFYSSYHAALIAVREMSLILDKLKESVNKNAPKEELKND
jgi:hypothetical protein